MINPPHLVTLLPGGRHRIRPDSQLLRRASAHQKQGKPPRAGSDTAVVPLPFKTNTVVGGSDRDRHLLVRLMTAKTTHLDPEELHSNPPSPKA